MGILRQMFQKVFSAILIKHRVIVRFFKSERRTLNMSSKKSKKKSACKQSFSDQGSKNTTENWITLNKCNDVIIKILAKPGAKQNAVTDISEEGVGVQINARPTDGEANQELIQFMSIILGVKKGNVSLERGFKSRQKTIKVDGLSLDEVRNKINDSISNG